MFKDKLKQLREKAGLSQYQLAEKIFVSRSAIAKWENGNGIPSVANLETICNFFDVKEEWLLDRDDLKEIAYDKGPKFIKLKKYHFASLSLTFIFLALIYLDDLIALIKDNETQNVGMYSIGFIILFIVFYLLNYFLCFIFHIMFDKKIQNYNQSPQISKKINLKDILFSLLGICGIVLFILTCCVYKYLDSNFISQEWYLINGHGYLFLTISWIMSINILVLSIFLETNNILLKANKKQ